MGKFFVSRIGDDTLLFPSVSVPVCTSIWSPCVHVEKRVRVLPANTGRFKCTHGVFCVPHHDGDMDRERQRESERVRE